MLGGASVYGPIGIIISSIYAVFPHALMIILTALLLADRRLYEAAESLGTPTLRRFFTITLPGAKYGLISAAMVVFSYTVSDFGIPKVIGGNFSVLALDIFKQVIGQQNFNKGAVVSLILLIPVLVAFVVDWTMQGRQQAQFSSRAVPYAPKPKTAFDAAMFLYCLIVCLLLLAILGMAIYTSFIKLWPYDKTFSLTHYTFGLIDGGVISSFFNSLKMALLTAFFGTILIFGGAYLIEKTPRHERRRVRAIRMLAAIPMGVPGMVLGLGYIFFFNHPDNPLNGLYHGMTILVVVDDHSLLHVQPPHRRHGAEIAGQRIRSGVGVAQGAFLQDIFPRHRSRLPAGDPRHRALSVHQRHGDHIRRGVSLRAGHAARVARHPQSRRRRRNRRRPRRWPR